MEKFNIYKKLNEARRLVREGGYKKDARNDYSKYDYFSPESVETIVWEVCQETNLMVLTDLDKDEYGLKQLLQLLDLDSGEMLPKPFILRTEKGELKATNDTQKMGGTDTYSERYIKMKVFQIKDNNLDFDSKDHRESKTASNNKIDDLDL